MPRVQQRFEEAGGQRLPLGGLNGYLGVRGKQGHNKNMFQGISPKKKHRTKLFYKAQDAAIAYAQLKEDLSLGMLEQRQPSQKPVTPATAAAPKRWELGTLLGRLPQPPRAVIPTVACADLLLQRAWSKKAAGGECSDAN